MGQKAEGRCAEKSERELGRELGVTSKHEIRGSAPSGQGRMLVVAAYHGSVSAVTQLNKLQLLVGQHNLSKFVVSNFDICRWSCLMKSGGPGTGGRNA